MQAQIQSNVNKAYVALQASTSIPSNTALPGVINTRRPKLSNRQIAARYLKSIAGNPDIDIAKVSRMVVRDRVERALPLSGLDASPKAAPRRNVHDQRSDDDIVATMRKRGVAERSATLKSDYQWRETSPPFLSWAYAAGCFGSSCGSTHHHIFEIVGPDPSWKSLMSPVTLLDSLLLTHYELQLEAYLSILGDADLCKRLTSRGFKNCKVFSFGDQFAQIEDFVRSSSNQSGGVIVVAPDVIELWGTTSQVLQQQGMYAYAIRSYDWQERINIGWTLSAVAVVPVAAIISAKYSDKIIDCARRMRQAVQRCRKTLAQTNNDATVDNSDKNPDSDDRNDVDTKSSTVIEVNDAEVSSSSTYLGDSSSSSGQGRETNANVRADNAPDQAEADIDTGEETSDVLV